MENQHKEIFEVIGGNLAYWLLPLVNTNIENSMARQSQCRNYLAVEQSPENRTEQQGFLKALDLEEEGLDMINSWTKPDENRDSMTIHFHGQKK